MVCVCPVPLKSVLEEALQLVLQDVCVQVCLHHQCLVKTADLHNYVLMENALIDETVVIVSFNKVGLGQPEYSVHHSPL